MPCTLRGGIFGGPGGVQKIRREGKGEGTAGRGSVSASPVRFGSQPDLVHADTTRQDTI